MQSDSIQASKIIPVDVLKTIVEGSFEHFGAVVDHAIEKSESALPESDSPWRRVATFKDRVVMGNEDGKFINVHFESKNGSISILSCESVDVPVVTSTNALKMRIDMGLGAVDAILSEDSNALSKILTFSELLDSDELVNRRNYKEEAEYLVSEDIPWRSIYESQRKSIRRQVVGLLESIKDNSLVAKYKKLYETDEIPESEFDSYRDPAESDLKILSGRIETLIESIASEYVPFAETISEEDLSGDGEVLSHLCFFAEDLISNLEEISSLINDTLENERCVMCLGQVYDTIAESLSHYEIAGAFVGRMIGDFVNAA